MCSHVSATDIGVMAPYRSQVQKLRLLLRERGLGAVRVGTVDDYQVRPTSLMASLMAL